MYVVDFDPVALQIGPVAIRWYALAYLAGFIGGLYYLRALVRFKQLPLTTQHLEDFLTYAIAGVLLGGRLGFVLFYDLPYYLEHPLHVLYLWKGGMSFHGGLAGIILAILLFAYNKKLDPFMVGDLIAAAGPIGLFLGRVTNFVNGELWGRITTHPFGMVFPHAGPEPRHPSQLYEAGLEGLVLFTFLWFMAFRTDALRHPGRLGGVFLCGYALFRFGVEFVREPDAQLGFLYAGATMGQVLCLPMLAFGIWVFLRSFRQNGRS